MIIQNKNSSYIQNLYKNAECSILNGQRKDTIGITNKKYIINIVSTANVSCKYINKFIKSIGGKGKVR